METTTNFLHKIMNDFPEESKWIIMNGLPYMPQARIYQILLQLEQDILKKVLLKKGKHSDEYKFFTELKNVLYQAGEAVHLIELLNNELIAFKTYNDFLQQRNNELEREVNRWRTLEELNANGLLEVYINRVRDLMKDELDKKKKGNLL